MTDFRHVGIIFIPGATQTFRMKRSTAQGTVEDYGKLWHLWATSCSALISQKYSCYVERKMTGITVEFPECLHRLLNVERACGCIFVSPLVIQPTFCGWFSYTHLPESCTVTRLWAGLWPTETCTLPPTPTNDTGIEPKQTAKGPDQHQHVCCHFPQVQCSVRLSKVK